jgi:hypothetical protein
MPISYAQTHCPTPTPTRHCQEHPDLQEDFSDGMQSIDGLGLAAIIADYDWNRYSRYLDIGGASGSVLNALLAHNPSAASPRHRRGCSPSPRPPPPRPRAPALLWLPAALGGVPDGPPS